MATRKSVTDPRLTLTSAERVKQLVVNIARQGMRLRDQAMYSRNIDVIGRSSRMADATIRAQSYLERAVLPLVTTETLRAGVAWLREQQALWSEDRLEEYYWKGQKDVRIIFADADVVTMYQAIGDVLEGILNERLGLGKSGTK
jgi:hypothetical protein